MHVRAHEDRQTRRQRASNVSADNVLANIKASRYCALPRPQRGAKGGRSKGGGVDVSQRGGGEEQERGKPDLDDLSMGFTPRALCRSSRSSPEYSLVSCP